MEGQQQKQAAQQAKKQQVEQYRQSILSQILTPEARDRLIKIKIVKPQKVMAIENYLIQTAQSGVLKNRVSENQLVALLQKQSAQKSQTKMTVTQFQNSLNAEELMINFDQYALYLTSQYLNLKRLCEDNTVQKNI